MSKFLWDFDQDAIDAAAKELGLRYPIHIAGKRGAVGRSNGHYSGLNRFNYAARDYNNHIWSTPHHVIKVDRRSSAAFASETIWHELQHAVQCERHLPENDPGDYALANRLADDEYEQAGGHSNGSKKSQKRYKENWLEVEAEEVAKAYKDWSLVKLTKKGLDRAHFLAQREGLHRELNRVAAEMDAEESSEIS